MNIELVCGPGPTQLVRTVIPVTPEKLGFANNIWSPLGSWFINGVQAQYEPVTRAWNGCPDTIELIAPVSVSPGAIADLNVVFQSGVAQLPSVAMPQLGSFRVECVDNQNRAYNYSFADANGVRVKDGPYQQITRFAGTLKDSAGSTELLGCIVLLTQDKDSNLIGFDIFFHNGLADKVIGNIYFKSVTIYSQTGHTFYTRNGHTRPCGQASPNTYKIAKDGSYFWPKQAGLFRRLLMKANGLSLNRKELTYKQDYGGTAFWLNWTDQSFGVTKTGLGDVTDAMQHYGNDDGLLYHGRAAMKKIFLEKYVAMRQALESGGIAEWVGIYSGAYGPFHPFYLSMQGAPSGFGIEQYAGYSRTLEELQQCELLLAMNIERQPWNTWHANGVPKTADDFAAEGGGTIQFDFAPYDYGINGVPAFIAAGDYNVGSADRSLATFENHDAAHQCRMLKPLQALAYNNDYMAKELLQHAAEIDYLFLNLYPQVPGWSGGQNLKKMLADAKASPRQGGLMGRIRCWPMDGVMSWYHLAKPEWRARVEPWIEACAEMLGISQMPTGWNTRHGGDSGDQVVETAALPPQYDVGQTFEIEFEDWVKRCLLVGLSPTNRFRKVLNKMILRSAKSFFTTPIYSGTAYRWYIANGHNHGNAFTPGELQYALTSQGDEIFQGWFVLNHAFLASQETGDTSVDWLAKALTYRAAVSTPQAKLDQLSALASDDWNYHLPQAMGLMQSLKPSPGPGDGTRTGV